MRSIEPFPGSAMLGSGGMGSTVLMAQQAAVFFAFSARSVEVHEAQRAVEPPRVERAEPAPN